MKATELRIGNILDYHGRRVRVRSIGCNIDGNCAEFGYFTDSVGFTRNIDDDFPKPIPLTEEWLKKFGFKRTLNTWKIDGLKIYGYNDIGYNTFMSLENKIAIKYVHQLQNLCFALTGEELVMTQLTH